MDSTKSGYRFVAALVVLLSILLAGCGSTSTDRGNGSGGGCVMEQGYSVPHQDHCSLGVPIMASSYWTVEAANLRTGSSNQPGETAWMIDATMTNHSGAALNPGKQNGWSLSCPDNVLYNDFNAAFASQVLDGQTTNATLVFNVPSTTSRCTLLFGDFSSSNGAGGYVEWDLSTS